MHHNARRRKPQADTISFNSSTMFYDTSQRTDLFFSQPLYGQARSNAGSPWDNLGGFKLMQTKHLPAQPTKTVGLDELRFSALQISTSVAAHTGHHHDLDGFMTFKGTNTKVLNQGVEAWAAASSSNNGGPEVGRALSLLSDGSWGSSSAVIQQPTSHADAGALPPLVTVAVSNAAAAAGHPLNPSPGRFWPQDDHPPLDGSMTQIPELVHLRIW